MIDLLMFTTVTFVNLNYDDLIEELQCVLKTYSSKQRTANENIARKITSLLLESAKEIAEL